MGGGDLRARRSAAMPASDVSVGRGKLRVVVRGEWSPGAPAEALPSSAPQIDPKLIATSVGRTGRGAYLPSGDIEGALGPLIEGIIDGREKGLKGEALRRYAARFADGITRAMTRHYAGESKPEEK